VAAIADALRIANGFLPVRVEFPCPVPTKLFVPEDLSLSLIIFFARPEFYYSYFGCEVLLDLPLLVLEFVD